MNNKNELDRIYTIEGLTETERRAINKALEILSPSQLYNLALRIKGMGFGRVYVDVKNNHPRFIGQETTADYPRDVDDETLKSQLDQEEKNSRIFTP